MSNRIPCKKCGTQVLEVILKSNSGICLSCYNPNTPQAFSDEVEDCSDVELTKALQVAQKGASFTIGDGENKLLGFLLRDGECDVLIRKQNIAVRYSWLRKKPSTYFIELAAGVVGKLMEFGGVNQINGQATFRIKLSKTGFSKSFFFHPKKWVRITCHEESIEIKVRDKEKRLDEELEFSTETNP